MSKESRTWEQMKADNDGAVWIDENGEFCSAFTRSVSDPAVTALLDKEDGPEWAKTGFNGCWSCDKADTCERYLSSFRTRRSER